MTSDHWSHWCEWEREMYTLCASHFTLRVSLFSLFVLSLSLSLFFARIWSNFVDCVRRYVTGCFSEQKRAKFNQGKVFGRTFSLLFSLLFILLPSHALFCGFSVIPYVMWFFTLTLAVENSVDTVHAICSSESVQRGKLLKDSLRDSEKRRGERVDNWWITWSTPYL